MSKQKTFDLQTLRRLIEAGDGDALERYYIRHVLPHDKRSAEEITTSTCDGDAAGGRGS